MTPNPLSPLATMPLFAEAKMWIRAMGDQTPVAWLITFAYLAAALLSFLASLRRLNSPPHRHGPAALWLILGAIALFMGLNKQLDFQLLLFYEARALAREQGWYPYRHYVTATCAALAAVAGGFGIYWLNRMRAGLVGPSVVAMTGLALLLIYVLLRTVGITHIDDVLGTEIGRHHFVPFEVLGVLLILGGAAWEAFGRRRPRKRVKRVKRAAAGTAPTETE